MFTGIIEALGVVGEVARAGAGVGLSIDAPAELARDMVRGDSLAVNGVCLTVVDVSGARLAFDVADETRRVTTLGDLGPGETVNLERPVRLGTRLGGHLVLGHVDGTGRVVAVAPDGAGRRVTFEAPAALSALLIPKGSVTVDGVSLTVADLDGNRFSVALIPHTLAVTTLGARTVGARVNLEMDVIGKYVRALLAGDDEARHRFADWGSAAPAREGSRVG